MNWREEPNRATAEEMDPLCEIRARYKDFFDRRARLVAIGNGKKELLDQVFAEEEEEKTS